MPIDRACAVVRALASFAWAVRPLQLNCVRESTSSLVKSSKSEAHEAEQCNASRPTIMLADKLSHESKRDDKPRWPGSCKGRNGCRKIAIGLTRITPFHKIRSVTEDQLKRHSVVGLYA